MKIIIALLFSVLIAGCSERREIDEMTLSFFEHQASFEALANISCPLKTTLNTQFHDYKIDTAMEYPEHLATQFIKINSLLKRINAEGIAIFPPSDNKLGCSLYIDDWALGFAGSGSAIGYSYNPKKLEVYDATLHQPEKLNYRKFINFAKPLANNWYIEYVNNP